MVYCGRNNILKICHHILHFGCFQSSCAYTNMPPAEGPKSVAATKTGSHCKVDNWDKVQAVVSSKMTSCSYVNVEMEHKLAKQINIFHLTSSAKSQWLSLDWDPNLFRANRQTHKSPRERWHTLWPPHHSHSSSTLSISPLNCKEICGFVAVLFSFRKCFIIHNYQKNKQNTSWRTSLLYPLL